MRPRATCVRESQASRRACLSAAAILVMLGLLLPGAALPQRKRRGHSAPKQSAPAKSKSPAKGNPPEIVAPSGPPEKQLASLARVLREEGSATTYARLGEFANANASSELGARAALALAYYDFTKGRHPQAARWLEKAGKEEVLREYVLYWRSQVNRVTGRNAEALAQLETLRRDFPDSAQTESIVQSLAEAAILVGKPERALEALDAYARTPSKPALLLLRAEAREKARHGAAAASDYITLYYRQPMSDEAKIAGKRLSALEHSLGAEFPALSAEMKLARPQAFYDAHKWKEARAEYEKLVPRFSGAEKQKAQLRVLESRIQSQSSPAKIPPKLVKALALLDVTDPEVDAERLYALSQAHRSLHHETEMLEAIDQLLTRYPQSRWAEDGLFSAGNYFWVNLDRKRAVSYYQRVLAQSRSARFVDVAQWRISWLAYLERRPEASALFEEHLKRFPGSQHTANALYWLGRAAERDGNVAHARSFYLKAEERYRQTYFGQRAIERLRPEPAGIGTEPVNTADFLSLIPPPVPLTNLDEPIPPAAAERWARAEALRMIAFDASAELELRAAYASTSSARLMWEAAKSALDAGHYSVGIATIRQAFPQLEARRMEEIPDQAWRIVFPLPYERSLKQAAERNHVDPMLVAGVIRQESVFQPDAVSHAGAVGLMQVLPKTGKLLARRLKVRFSRSKLFNAEYNLLLGTLYLKDLVDLLGSPEAALAAFNAGEDRVAAWKGEREFAEPAEFVESIPFSETREYVQICMRNAELYRRLYGNPQ